MDALPSLFVSHGSPMIALEPGDTGAFLSRLGPALRARFGTPQAVLAISAHTLARQPVLLAAPRHEAVYDFGGFPPALSQLRYDAPGAPALAPRVAAALQTAGFDAPVSPQGGLDHGIWTMLRYLMPEADIPVLPLAFDPGQSPERLMAFGAALQPLRSEGVLVLATGSITHNLRRLFGRASGLPKTDEPEIVESAAFRQWFFERASARDWESLARYRSLAPFAVDMHPTDEHLLPWFVAAGAGGTSATPQRVFSAVTYGALGMDVYAFGMEAGESLSC
jgi:4,5-DOPA dioxygenase extradiol